MSDKPKLIVVRVDRQPAAKFVVIVDDQAFPKLSLNNGELAEPEIRKLLADERRLSPSEIEALIRQAKANPAVKPTPVQKR
jgi:ribonuclease I